MSGNRMLTPGVISTPGVQNSLRCFIAPGFWYFDRWEEKINPPEAYKYLISNAVNKICIWDPYLHPHDVSFFSNFPMDISVKVLTCFGRTSQKLDRIITNAKLASRDWHFHIKVKYYDKYLDGSDSSTPFHDRYLFVDNRVFMVGASIEHHHNRLSTNAILEIIDGEAKALVRERFDTCWTHSFSRDIFSFEGGVFVP